MKGEFTPKEKKQALEDFELFLFNMDDVLKPFVEQAQTEGFALDYSLDNLAHLENYSLKLDAKPLSNFHGQASQYLGETVRKVFRGRWKLSLDMKENSLNYGRPVIIGHSKYDVEFPPYQIMLNFMLRPVSGLLKRAVFSQLKHYGLKTHRLTRWLKPVEG